MKCPDHLLHRTEEREIHEKSNVHHHLDVQPQDALDQDFRLAMESRTNQLEDTRLAVVAKALPESLQNSAVLQLLRLSLLEDLNPQAHIFEDEELSGYDLTSAATFPAGKELVGRIFPKVPGVLAGLPLARAVFQLIDPAINFESLVSEGEGVQAREPLARLKGPAASLLAGERTALNFLGRMAGIATLTRQFVDRVKGTRAVILDTRKTAPGFRILDKYAVRMGGGQNHRMGLYDMILIKNNHIDGAGGIQAAVERVRRRYGDRFPIEVEVRTLEELSEALQHHPTRIMLDNMDLETMQKAVERTAGSVPLEASGNVSLETVAQIAATGVNYISVGALTHSARVWDVSMHLEQS